MAADVIELPTGEPRLLITTAEAARQLSICTKTLRGLLHADLIRPVRIGQKVLIPQTALDAYVEELMARAEPYADTAS